MPVHSSKALKHPRQKKQTKTISKTLSYVEQSHANISNTRRKDRFVNRIMTLKSESLWKTKNAHFQKLKNCADLSVQPWFIQHIADHNIIPLHNWIKEYHNFRTKSELCETWHKDQWNSILEEHYINWRKECFPRNKLIVKDQNHSTINAQFINYWANDDNIQSTND